MFHKSRVWCVSDIGSVGELADWLVNRCGCGCVGFRLSGYLFLNDSAPGDSAEWAIVKEPITNGRALQVESITFGWCDLPKATEYIRRAIAGEFDAQGWQTPIAIDEAGGHRCSLCA